MILYHGGEIEIPVPDLVHSRKAVDFGPGFYVTPIFEQAKLWCEKRRRRWKRATISRYAFDASEMASLKWLTFETYSEAWLDFIVKCRAERDDSDWDIVSGGIANDRVFDTLEAFFDGFATRAQTIAKLRLEVPNVQFCFRTERALKTLTFLGSEEV